MTYRSRKVLIWAAVLLISVVHWTGGSLKAMASEGLGVSGSFASHHYRMVPGETMEAGEIEVIFFNNTNADMVLRLEGKGPSGIRFFFEQEQITLKAQSKVTIPVSFKLSEVQGLGESEISVAAHLVSKVGAGVSLSGFAQLSAKLTVISQAGDLLVNLVDVRKQSVSAKLVLVRLNDDKTQTPIKESTAQSLSERLVPGTYQITALKEGIIIAQERFELKDKDRIEITLIANFVSIPLFLAGLQKDDSGQINNVLMAYTLRNIDRPEKNVRMIVRFEKDGKIEEEQTVMSLPELVVGESSGRLTLSPSQGFTQGNLSVTLYLMSSDGTLLATSKPQTLEVIVKDMRFELMDLSGWIAMGLVASLTAILFRRKTSIKS